MLFQGHRGKRNIIWGIAWKLTQSSETPAPGDLTSFGLSMAFEHAYACTQTHTHTNIGKDICKYTYK